MAPPVNVSTIGIMTLLNFEARRWAKEIRLGLLLEEFEVDVFTDQLLNGANTVYILRQRAVSGAAGFPSRKERLPGERQPNDPHD